MRNELQKKAVDTAQTFLERRDYKILEVLDGSDIFDIVAHGEGQLAFVEVAVRTGEDFPDEVVTADKRKHFEQMSIKYLAENAETLPAYLPFRFDNISIVVFDDHKAGLRWHQNVFGLGEHVATDEEEKLKNTVEKLRKIHQHMIPED